MLSGEGTRYARTYAQQSDERWGQQLASMDGDLAVTEWLRMVKWDWFVTLTARRASTVGASEERAKRAALEWIGALRARAPKAYVAFVVESGAHLGGWHAHVLVGGLGAHPEWGEELEQLWAHGHALVRRYDPVQDPKMSPRGVMPYLQKQSDIEIVGRLKRWRPRRSRNEE